MMPNSEIPTDELIKAIPTPLLRQASFPKIGNETAIEVMHEYRSQTAAIPQQAQQEVPGFVDPAAGALIGAAIGAAIFALLPVPEQNDLWVSVPLIGGGVGAALGYLGSILVEVKVERKRTKWISNRNFELSQAHRQELASRLTEEEIQALYLQAMIAAQ